jgi:predicted RNA-binding Zn-ribbon protein involved in translation (DUF1610 family)
MAEQIVTLWRYRDLPEALVAKSKLDSENVWCFLADQEIVRLDWFLSNAVGGVRLQVGDDEVQIAIELLSEEIPASFSADEIGEEYRQPECPRCGSRDVSLETMAKKLAFLLLCLLFQLTAVPALLAGPLWIFKKPWRCQECRYDWKAEYE